MKKAPLPSRAPLACCRPVRGADQDPALAAGCWVLAAGALPDEAGALAGLGVFDLPFSGSS